MHDKGVYTTTWTWADPLEAILQFGGWSIEEALEDRGVAEQFSMLWEVRQESKRLSAEREQRNRVEEVLWSRQQGVPVPCPFCKALDPCSCRVSRPR